MNPLLAGKNPQLTDKLFGQPYWTALLDSLIGQSYWAALFYRRDLHKVPMNLFKLTLVSHNVGFSRNHNARYKGKSVF
jgi:hypothetical protein